MDKKKGAETADKIAKLNESVAFLEKSKVSVSHGGKAGYFVPKTELNLLIDDVEKLINQDSTTDVIDAYWALREEVGKLEKTNSDAEKALKALRKDLEEMQGKRDKALLAWKAAKEDRDSTSVELKKIKATLQEEKEQLTKDLLAKEKAKAEDAQLKFDADAALKHQEQIDALRLTIKQLTLRQEENNKLIDKKNKEVVDLKKVEAQLTEACNDLKKKNYEITSALAKLVTPRQTNEAAYAEAVADLRTKYTEKAAAAFANLWVLSPDNYREKLWTLIEGFKVASKHKYATLIKLLKTVYDWVKSQTWKARAAVAPFTNALMEDVKKFDIKPIDHYRKLLTKIHFDIFGPKPKKFIRSDPDTPLMTELVETAHERGKQDPVDPDPNRNKLPWWKRVVKSITRFFTSKPIVVSALEADCTLCTQLDAAPNTWIRLPEKLDELTHAVLERRRHSGLLKVKKTREWFCHWPWLYKVTYYVMNVKEGPIVLFDAEDPNGDGSVPLD